MGKKSKKKEPRKYWALMFSLLVRRYLRNGPIIVSYSRYHVTSNITFLCASFRERCDGDIIWILAGNASFCERISLLLCCSPPLIAYNPLHTFFFMHSSSSLHPFLHRSTHPYKRMDIQTCVSINQLEASKRAQEAAYLIPARRDAIYFWELVDQEFMQYF